MTTNTTTLLILVRSDTSAMVTKVDHCEELVVLEVTKDFANSYIELATLTDQFVQTSLQLVHGLLIDCLFAEA